MLPVSTISEILCCLRCRGALSPEAGGLTCKRCGQAVAVHHGVVDFLGDDGYTQSFGFQWRRHRHTQIDRFNGTRISHERFFRQTQWQSQQLSGKKVLELGCGAGRFTEVALETGAQVYSMDASSAAFVNAENNDHPNLCVLRASLLDQPFLNASFDAMFCFGVIQHTPNVEQAFKSLFEYLKPGGLFCVDVYAAPLAYLHPRHLLRPLTRRMQPERLYGRVEALVKCLFPLADAALRVPGIGQGLARLVPVAHWGGAIELRDRAQYLEWSILDTFDWYSPRYESPQPLGKLQRWCRELQLQDYTIERYRGLFVIRGIR